MGVTSPYNFDLLPIGCGGFDLIYSTNPSFSGSKRALFSREGHSDSLANPEDKLGAQRGRAAGCKGNQSVTSRRRLLLDLGVSKRCVEFLVRLHKETL